VKGREAGIKSPHPQYWPALIDPCPSQRPARRARNVMLPETSAREPINVRQSDARVPELRGYVHARLAVAAARARSQASISASLKYLRRLTINGRGNPSSDFSSHRSRVRSQILKRFSTIRDGRRTSLVAGDCWCTTMLHIENAAPARPAREAAMG
jgi:hypothetical protein